MDYPSTSMNILIFIWLLPGLLLSISLVRKDLYGTLLIPIFATGFWSLLFSFTDLQNFTPLRNRGILIYLLYVLTLMLVFIKKKNLFFGYLVILLFVNLLEILNRQFGLVNPSGSSVNIFTSIYNMEYSSLYEFGAPQLYIVNLSFFFAETTSVLLCITLVTGITAFILSGVLLGERFNVNKKYLFLSFIFPIFNFEVISWILRIRPHFVTSGLTLLFISSCFLYRKNGDWDSKVMIFTSIFLIMNGRTESIILFSLFILTSFILEIEKIFLTKFSLVFFITTYLSTIESVWKYDGLRSPQFSFAAYVLFGFIFFLGSRFEKIHFLITKRFNLILSLFVGTIFIFVLYLYNDLAFQSYRVMFVRLADPGTGYGALFVFYLALLLIISKGNEAEVNKIVTCMYLLILFVFFSGPFQHSIFGWETFNQPYLGEESLIYNPFDESQSRLIMQLYLVIAPLLTCSIFSKQKTIKLSG